MVAGSALLLPMVGSLVPVVMRGEPAAVHLFDIFPGIGFAFVMALVTFDSLLMTLAPPFVYWLINTAEGQFLTPVAVGRRLKLNAVAVFLSLAFWAWLWSFVGMFLSTPMLIALKAFTERTSELSWLDTFLQGRTECDPNDNAIVHDVLDDDGTDACDAPDAIPEEERFQFNLDWML